MWTLGAIVSLGHIFGVLLLYALDDGAAYESKRTYVNRFEVQFIIESIPGISVRMVPQVFEHSLLHQVSVCSI